MPDRELREVMTPDPVALSNDSTVAEAAKAMRDGDIGNVVVLDGESPCGIVTDRDLVLRVMAEGKDPASTRLGDVCTKGLVTLEPSASVDDAVKLMKDKAVRRLLVVEGGKPAGIVSIGDLAIEAHGESALADISAAEPNN